VQEWNSPPCDPAAQEGCSDCPELHAGPLAVGADNPGPIRVAEVAVSYSSYCWGKSAEISHGVGEVTFKSEAA